INMKIFLDQAALLLYKEPLEGLISPL
ncbi:MAG: hypothetical protein UV33_C0001G0001, partial [Candidatus Daviesbacteria bacterium GW2011_GWA1_42_6]